MSSSARNEIKHVTVVGSGIMGSGIAQVAASYGFNVTLVDLNDDLITKSKVIIKKHLELVASKKFNDDKAAHSKFVTDSFNRIQGSSNLAEAVKSTDIVIESVIENLKIKQKIFSIVDKVAPEHTIFASNTSSLSITEIASVTNRKDRFGGFHFFNPVPIMKLVEVVRIDETSDDTHNKLMKFGADLEKICVTCKDTPGFIVNRLLLPYMAEAVRMLERGDATTQDIDTAMKLGAGYLIGPFELMDYIGLDTVRYIFTGWHQKYPDDPLFQPSKIIDEKVEKRKLGVKSGEGFYKYFHNRL